MKNKKNIILFSAPYEFLNFKKKNVKKDNNIKFKIINNLKDLYFDNKVIGWIPNPGQNFIIDKRVINYFPNLQVIVTPSTGNNHINLKDCSNNSIKVFSLMDSKKDLKKITASSEFTFLKILNSLRHIERGYNEVKRGNWRENENYMRGRQLNNKNIGLIGLGRIGKNIAKWSTAFGASVSYYDPFVFIKKFKKISIKKIFSQSDIICLCCTYNNYTHHLINSNLLNQMKKNTILINTSRGEIINEKSLINLIKKRKDIEIHLDVLYGEVTNTQFDSELIKMHNSNRIKITPHISGATIESQNLAAKIAINLLEKNIT